MLKWHSPSSCPGTVTKREMSKEQEPKPIFTPWAHWSERGTVRNAHLPGVYLLAHWEHGPPGSIDPQAKMIAYIGEVTDSSLLGRWQQFHRAAFEGKPGHSGGLRYRDIFGDEGEHLYVSAYAPESLSREMRPLYIRYLERKLVWEWALRWDGPPLCNAI
jgi:hypothetical protein